MILLDTCVVSELARAVPDARVLAWFDSVEEASLWLSVLTIGEIAKGAALLDPGPRRERIHAWLDALTTWFSPRLLAVDEVVARRWGVISAETRRAGQSRPPVDALLAATALAHGLRLATRNISDFSGMGAELVNPWDGPGSNPAP